MQKRHDLKNTRVAREYDLAAGPVPCILVIDDEKAIRDSFAAHLEDWGYEVLVAGNGRIGLSLFEAQNPDLVIVDLRMPVVDGIQVLEQISRTSPLTPLIVASGTGIITDAIEALNCGAWEYLLKPIEDLSMLSHAVATALEKARLKRENLAYRERLERLVDERAVELAQANTDLAQINERLRHIADTTRTLSFCREVPSFAARVLEAFGQHLSAGGGSLYLKESNGLCLIHALDKGHAADFIPFPLPDGSLFQRTMAAQAPMLVPAIDDDARVVPSGWPGYTDGSALVFPLPGEAGDIAGIVSLHNKRPPPFGEPDREIGAILAAYSGEALRGLKATETLRESEARLREILDAIPTGIVIVDAASHHIVYVNPTAAAMIGDTPESLRGSACRGVICPSDVDACPVHDGCGVEPSQRTLLKRDGREVPVLKTAVRTRLAGRDCFLESFIDLSEQIQAEADREQLERRLRQAQRMAALGTLAGGIVHDFNNILSTVLGYAELGLQDIQDPAHPLYPKLKAIHHAGHRARELVEQIGSFSRMQQQRPAPVKPAPFVEADDEKDRRRP